MARHYSVLGMLMLLGGAFEFWKQYNKEIIERETDDSLPNLGENKKERPLSLPYSLKARILIHSYLTRIPLDNEGLECDQRYVLARVLRLIEEMISISQQLSFYTQTKVPIETLDNLLRLQPMFVQALWPKNSPLLQLPHITDHNLPYLRKGRVFSCGDLAAMDGEKRRNVLKSLSDEEYRNVLVVLSSMPRLSIQTAVVVEGEDDDHEITAGCVVTIKVTLTRTSLLDPIVSKPKLQVDFDAKSHKTHLVHCPYFPSEKYEWWWLVMTMWDKKQRRLVCPTVACKTLVDEQTVEMRFSAPPVKGTYNFQLSVRSDSYMDCDYNKDIKVRFFVIQQ
ncbi:unnamed protein product [Heligmosomoides polygyrus]|uniref:SEC63 domain-containing protein n=1 Tax=Heligmosomoides polygyrus TaxID=6339 RepID=A0A3P8GKS3_HELPZ|nr:unnamed protein product [Heligmosomoides polygyrus]